ncbi:MAG: hypothetical protein KDC98_23685 [Planctomycetes bacterium]|nr:hypothetical protein [Planctomycetota bacterium]
MDRRGGTDRTRRRHIGAHAEAALVTGLLLLLGIALGDWHSFVALAPSPLLLPILWGALRGGLLPALTALLLAGAVHTLGTVVAAGHDLDALTDRTLSWPLFAFALVAYAVGTTRDRIASQLAAARADRERLRSDSSRQRQDNEVLEHANLELKRRIFDRSFDFDSLVATVARSSVDDDEHMFEVPLGMLTDFCGATKCSVLLVLPDGTLDLAAHRGWSDEEIGPRLTAANNSTRILRTIVEARPFIDLAEDDGDAAGPLLIAPVPDATGVIKALVCIDEMPPARFEESLVKTFLGIVSWLATNLRRIQLREATGENKQHMLLALDKKKYIGTPADLAERIHLEDARRKRYSVESEFIAVRLMDVRANMADFVDALEGYLVNVLSSAVRTSDDVFRFGFSGCYVLVLTACRPGNGQNLVDRLEARFASSRDRDLGPVELCHFTTTTEQPTLASLLPTLTEHFCGASPLPLVQQCPVPEPRAQRSGNAEEFARRLRLETELAHRLGVELNMIDFRREGSGIGVGPMIARHLWNSVGTLLRVTDGIYVVSPNRCVVLLPFTTCLDASNIWARLDETLRRTLPKDHYAEVHVDFLALDAANLRETVHYLAGPTDADATEGRSSTILTEKELQELAFTEAEFHGLHVSDNDPEADFRVISSNTGDSPSLPTAAAMTKRWEELFERDEQPAPAAPKAPGEATPATVDEAAETLDADEPDPDACGFFADDAAGDDEGDETIEWESRLASAIESAAEAPLEPTPAYEPVSEAEPDLAPEPESPAVPQQEQEPEQVAQQAPDPQPQPQPPPQAEPESETATEPQRSDPDATITRLMSQVDSMRDLCLRLANQSPRGTSRD